MMHFTRKESCSMDANKTHTHTYLHTTKSYKNRLVYNDKRQWCEEAFFPIIQKYINIEDVGIGLTLAAASNANPV